MSKNVNAYVGWSVSLPIVYLPNYIQGRSPNICCSISFPIVYLPNYIQGIAPDIPNFIYKLVKLNVNDARFKNKVKV